MGRDVLQHTYSSRGGKRRKEARERTRERERERGGRTRKRNNSRRFPFHLSPFPLLRLSALWLPCSIASLSFFALALLRPPTHPPTHPTAHLLTSPRTVTHSISNASFFVLLHPLDEFMAQCTLPGHPPTHTSTTFSLERPCQQGGGKGSRGWWGCRRSLMIRRCMI